jgi:adenine/guanine phosphoribosyltransferase-like PRPP-binding protein
VVIVEPFVRASPVPCLHEERAAAVRDPALLRSTLEPTDVELKTDVLFVADDMVQTGATFAAFRDAVKERSPRVRCVLLAMVWSPRAGGMFE